MCANGVQRLSGNNRFYGLLAFGFMASNARLDSHGKHEITHWSPLEAICWVPSESQQWPIIFHHWSFSIESRRGALGQSQDHLIPGNPSSTIFRYPHPRCFRGPGNQLRKPRIHGQSNYYNNKKYSCELSTMPKLCPGKSTYFCR